MGLVVHMSYAMRNQDADVSADKSTLVTTIRWASEMFFQMPEIILIPFAFVAADFAPICLIFLMNNCHMLFQSCGSSSRKVAMRTIHGTIPICIPQHDRLLLFGR
jgi:hypothetical protein